MILLEYTRSNDVEEIALANIERNGKKGNALAHTRTDTRSGRGRNENRWTEEPVNVNVQPEIERMQQRDNNIIQMWSHIKCTQTHGECVRDKHTMVRFKWEKIWLMSHYSFSAHLNDDEKRNQWTINWTHFSF